MQLPSLAHVNSFIKQLPNARENWTLYGTTMLRALVKTNRESRAAGMADMTILVLLWQLVLTKAKNLTALVVKIKQRGRREVVVMFL